MIDWQERAGALAASATDPRWADAVRAVPRHRFVPRFAERRADRSGWRFVAGADRATRDEWAAGVYTDRTLVTELSAAPAAGDGCPVPISASTRPSLTLRMLELLDVDERHDVVEIGTGTGYGLALLCVRVGDRRVASVDVEPELVDLARWRLHDVGLRPRLRAADAALREPDRPFDRLLATCGVDVVPPCWVRRARSGAVLLVPMAGPLVDGCLVRLVADGRGAACGRFVACGAGVLPLRRGSDDHGGRPAPAREQCARGRTDVDPALLAADRPLAMLVQHRLPGLRPRESATFPDGTPITVLTTADGSWARAGRDPDGRVTVRRGGPTDVWAVVEDVHEWWASVGRPSWSRFGLTVDGDAQVLWLDDPSHEVGRSVTRPVAAPAGRD